jgi:hypothetical protein
MVRSAKRGVTGKEKGKGIIGENLPIGAGAQKP